MIVVDTSAFVAIILREVDRHVYEQALFDAPSVAVSALSAFETRIVLGSRNTNRLQDFETLLVLLKPRIMPFDAAAAKAAHDAYRWWGKGSGSGAKLNMGDCAAYALAITLNVPLLYKGDDFARTNVRSALA